MSTLGNGNSLPKALVVRPIREGCGSMEPLWRSWWNACGGEGRNRTADAGLFRAALYRLSYLAVVFDCRDRGERVSNWGNQGVFGL